MEKDAKDPRDEQRRSKISVVVRLARHVLRSAVVGIFAAVLLGPVFSHSVLIGAMVGVAHWASEFFLKQLFSENE